MSKQLDLTSLRSHRPCLYSTAELTLLAEAYVKRWDLTRVLRWNDLHVED